MESNEIEQVSLDLLADEWLSVEERLLLDEICDADGHLGGRTVYVSGARHHVIVRVLRGTVHYRISGTLSRRRAITIMLGMAAFGVPFLGDVTAFLGGLLRHVPGP